MEQRTHRGGQPPCHEGGGRAPCLVGPWWLSSTYSCTHPLLLPPTNTKNPPIAQTRVLAHLAAIFDLFAQSSIHKTVWGIVLWYVTPPMVQLVFVLVLYLLQIFAA